MLRIRSFLRRFGERRERIERDVKSGVYDLDDERKAIGERHQLVNENSALFGHIMKELKGTAVEVSELDEFMA